VNQLVIVVSGNNGHGGFVDLIDESTNPPILITGGGAPFPFPPGSDTNSGDTSKNSPGLGQVIYDSVHNVALVSTSDQSISKTDQCSSAGKCTGIAVFDLSAKTFGPIIGFEAGTLVGGADNFAFNSATDQILAPDDADEPIIQAVDLNNTPPACTLTDKNVLADKGNDGQPHADPDTVGVDSTTNIWVIGPGYGRNVKVPVINLNGSKFGSGPGCAVTEAGKKANSVLLNLFTAGSLAVNSTRHQAFVIALQGKTNGPGDEVGLIMLPKKPVVQLTTSMLKTVRSFLPSDPDGGTFLAQGFPYSAAIDVCHNLGYAADGRTTTDPTYLAQIDLAKLRKSAAKIQTQLPLGTCWRTGSVRACDNNHGVKFFPVVP